MNTGLGRTILGPTKSSFPQYIRLKTIEEQRNTEKPWMGKNIGKNQMDYFRINLKNKGQPFSIEFTSISMYMQVHFIAVENYPRLLYCSYS